MYFWKKKIYKVKTFAIKGLLDTRLNCDFCCLKIFFDQMLTSLTENFTQFYLKKVTHLKVNFNPLIGHFKKDYSKFENGFPSLWLVIFFGLKNTAFSNYCAEEMDLSLSEMKSKQLNSGCDLGSLILFLKIITVTLNAHHTVGIYF